MIQVNPGAAPSRNAKRRLGRQNADASGVASPALLRAL
jgi:hypothetical protein